MFPCQDTPDVKSPYEFKVRSPLPVIASGIFSEAKDLGDGTKLYSYKQDVPIPSYLFALASGDIEQAKIGPRSVVATSPGMLNAAQWELEESTEKFIETVEDMVFPYVWRTYNVLILPPSFPYGGMEYGSLCNPITFVLYSIARRIMLTPKIVQEPSVHGMSDSLVLHPIRESRTKPVMNSTSFCMNTGSRFLCDFQVSEHCSSGKLTYRSMPLLQSSPATVRTSMSSLTSCRIHTAAT